MSLRFTEVPLRGSQHTERPPSTDEDEPPGDDVCPAPPPLDGEPPADRFCDLVLMGGVASGVVYPWAVVELARSYRFRSIGGTSVGAMAAALTAAAEFGRRTGAPAPFEVLRRAPAALGALLPDGRTRMLSLFQSNEHGKRLITLWGRLGSGRSAPGSSRQEGGAAEQGVWRGSVRVAREVLRVYARPCAIGALVGLAPGAAMAVLMSGLMAGQLFVLMALQVHCAAQDCVAAAMPTLPLRIALLVALLVLMFGLAGLALSLALVGALLGLAWALWSDFKLGVVDNGLGLCKGGTMEADGQEGRRPALSEWLHTNIQRSAGLRLSDRPLTFRDLWCAPAFPGAAPQPCELHDPEHRRSINLQMLTTSASHGRPYRLPLTESTSRLFFKLADLKDYFPPVVLDALKAAARPYAPLPGSGSDPPANGVDPDMLELPGADLPVVVAARLSLSFPLLLAAVPLWAIDYEAHKGQRRLKPCHFTDGGVSSNFPIHLFDAALPRWPTFGLLLDRRSPHRPDVDVWLPEFHGQGWGDNWKRFASPTTGGADAASTQARSERRGQYPCTILGFLKAIAGAATDWNDRTTVRMPHVRNRVARLMLHPGEGGLNIGMSREQILDMANRYGTVAGRLFVERFASEPGTASPAWRMHRWVRLNLLLTSLRDRLAGLATSVDWATYTVPMPEAIEQAVKRGPIADRRNGKPLEPAQAELIAELMAQLERLEADLQAAEIAPIGIGPQPEMRLRAPL